MKPFSMIDKDQVEIDFHKKVIKSKDFETLLSTDELIAKAQQEIDLFKKNAKEEMEKAHIEKEKEGFLAGEKKWSEQIALLQNKLDSLRQEFEKEMVPLVIQCGKKILGKELSSDKNMVIDIVKNSLKPVAAHKFIKIFVHKDDQKILEENKPQLQQVLELAESITIDTRPDISQGGCIIETESGIINATLDTLWESLEAALLSLLKRS